MMDKLNRTQLIELVNRIINVEGTEEEIDDMLTLLEENVLDPEVSKLIYWNDEELTAEEIVDKALSYKPIEL
jgi:hypothetical protein